MSQPETAKAEKKSTSLLIRGALWIVIGALIAAAIVCVIWVLIGDQDGLIGRAFLTILLLAGFAGIAILEAGLAPNRPDWLALSSMITWIVALLVGAVKIWLPEDSIYFGSGAERFFQLLLVVGILQLALVHVRLFTKAAQRHVTTFTRVIYLATLAFLVALAGMLIFYLTFPHSIEYGELYWRIVVALTILAAVGTTLIPLLNALFAPRAPRAAVQSAPVAQSWPTYADGVTPLPALPDATPDWNAYYTGYPTVQQTALPAGPTLPAAPVPFPVAPAYADVPQAAPMPEVPPVPQAPPVPPAPEGAAAPEIPPTPVAPPAPEMPSVPPAPGAFPPPPPAAPQPPQ